MKVDYQSSKVWFDNYPEKTCIVLDGSEVIFTSTDKGVKPLRMFFKTYGKWQRPITVIDRIMGKGAVMLAIICGANQVITPTMSQPALELAQMYHLDVKVENVVPYIINRTGDGRCPIETAVLELTNLDQGYQAIEEAISKLMARPKAQN